MSPDSTNTDMQPTLTNPHLIHEAQHQNFPTPHHDIVKYQNHHLNLTGPVPPKINLKKPRVTFNSNQVVKLEQEFNVQR